MVADRSKARRALTRLCVFNCLVMFARQEPVRQYRVNRHVTSPRWQRVFLIGSSIDRRSFSLLLASYQHSLITLFSFLAHGTNHCIGSQKYWRKGPSQNTPICPSSRRPRCSHRSDGGRAPTEAAGESVRLFLIVLRRSFVSYDFFTLQDFCYICVNGGELWACDQCTRVICRAHIILPPNIDVGRSHFVCIACHLRAFPKPTPYFVRTFP
jgi:hypothetical protein